MTKQRSSRRERQAAATRQDILGAARRLFATKGYTATSMAAIAAEADTAVQTIYDSVGSKHAIILALVESIEEEAGVGEFRQRIGSAQTAVEAISMFVSLTRRFHERSGDVFITMMTTAPIEPDVDVAWRRANQGHRMGAQFVAGLIARTGALKAEIPVEQAGDTIAVMTFGTTWQQLVRQYDWSADTCERWMNDSLTRLLLRDDLPA